MGEIVINDMAYHFDGYDEARMQKCAEMLNAWIEEFKADERYRNFKLTGLLGSKLILSAANSKIDRELMKSGAKLPLCVQVFDNELSLMIPAGTEETYVGYSEELTEYYEFLSEEHSGAPEDVLKMNAIIIFCYNNLAAPE